MKKIIFLLSLFIWISSHQIYGIIFSEEKVFQKISFLISKKLPKGINILIYNINLQNGDLQLENKLNKNFKSILSYQQHIQEYSIKYIDDVMKENVDKDFSIVESGDELKLISFGKLLDFDGVMLTSATVDEKRQKLLWSKDKKKFIKNKVILLQGNIFATDNDKIILRFSYYFSL